MKEQELILHNTILTQEAAVRLAGEFCLVALENFEMCGGFNTPNPEWDDITEGWWNILGLRTKEYSQLNGELNDLYKKWHNMTRTYWSERENCE